tara:strand:+ start:268 stop:816 length:549 start_codon:yes stop_codon:yes gene_type:complete
MKTFKQYITELFDKPYKWSGGGVTKGSITPKKHSKAEDYIFKTSDGGTIEVTANHWWMGAGSPSDIQWLDVRGIKEGHSIIIEFIKKRKSDDHRSTYDMTGEGDAMRILATVLDIIKFIIKKHEPITISFGADKKEFMGSKEKKTGRAGAYGAMVKRFAGKLGYKSIVKQAPDETKWALIRK